MQIVDLKINEIRPYENNPRNNLNAVDVVANSIREFGFKNPIVVDRNYTIINGHTRYQAAIKLGLTFVPVIVADDLSEEQIKAFRIMDNKSSEFAEWDYEKLLAEIKDIENVYDNLESVVGFDDIEISELERAFSNIEVEEPSDEVDYSFKPLASFSDECVEDDEEEDDTEEVGFVGTVSLPTVKSDMRSEGNKLVVFKIGNHNIHTTRDTMDAMEELIVEYLNETGSTVGFLERVLEVMKKC